MTADPGTGGEGGNGSATSRVERAMRRVRGIRELALGTCLVLGVALLGGCTSAPEPAPDRDTGVAPDGLRLVAFDSCDDALTRLKQAVRSQVGPWGLNIGGGRGGPAVLDGPIARAADAQAGAEAGTAPGASDGGSPDDGYSGTNTHEAGVDEPDMVKTDGRRIVVVTGGVLKVIDPVGRRVTGGIPLAADQERSGWSDAELLLHGDLALVLLPSTWVGPAMPVEPPVRDGVRTDGSTRPDGTVPPDAVGGPRLILVDLAGAPKIIGEYRVDGDLVDARQVGGTVRVVVRSSPRLDFRPDEAASDSARTAANRKIVDAAPLTAWLPRYEVTDAAGTTTTGQIGCDRLSRPAAYSGTSMVTVLSFDLAAAGTATAGLGDGDPVTVVADGDTVYSNGRSLYIANDQRWRVLPMLRGDAAPKPQDETTDIYQFDTAGVGRPRYVAAATVPGWLVNQYAMSEWDGHLRVATTSGQTWGENPKSSSAVYVLRADGSTLTETGRVTGLGKGERIYSVRFVGPTGYVVTFRETDPLYTVDISEPAAPRVTGELKITGYSAYLHPMGAGRLLGVGQEATSRGQTEGTQLSLFDVSDLTKPTRLAQHHVKRGQSEAEYDPHAFLYWPATQLLVVPMTTYDVPGGAADGRAPVGGALALRVTDSGFSELGMLDHAEVADPDYPAPIRRSLVLDGVLWTFSDGAAKATNMSTLDTLGLLRLT